MLGREQQRQLDEQFKQLAEQEQLLPVKLTQFYQQKVQAEIAALGHHDGPLHRSVYPSHERVNVRAPGEVADFVDDRTNMPAELEGVGVQKYDNRMLFFPTDACAAHCQYCFRQDVLAEAHEQNNPSSDRRLRILVDYLKDHDEVQEVILSGGDPLTLSRTRLQSIFCTLLEETHIRDIRLHSRVPVFKPSMITSETVRVIAEANARLVHHIVHPYELCAEVERCVAFIHEADVRQYNQFPMLRKINDHPAVLTQLLRRLDELTVRNLSIFIPDPINYSAAFRLRLKRFFAIIDTINQQEPAWISATRTVLDTPHGKVRREDIVSSCEQSNTVTFERDGLTIEYADLPAELDEPGKVGTLLWNAPPGND